MGNGIKLLPGEIICREQGARARSMEHGAWSMEKGSGNTEKNRIRTSLAVYQLFNFSFQYWNISCNNAPDNYIINAIVSMNNPISQINNSSWI